MKNKSKISSVIPNMKKEHKNPDGRRCLRLAKIGRAVSRDRAYEVVSEFRTLFGGTKG